MLSFLKIFLFIHLDFNPPALLQANKTNLLFMQSPNLLKIIFSGIKCKINLTESALFALVIRIGKISSRYSVKRQLHNSYLGFDQTLQVHFDQKLLFNQNNKKQKCEIMLYKFRMNREKQTKQLVGMASVAITSQMFGQQTKRIRLTNSYDKEAFIECQLKIQCGQADILSQNLSRISSLFVKSQAPSLNDIEQLKYDLQQRSSLHRSQIKKDPGKADPQYFFLNSAAQEMKNSKKDYFSQDSVKQKRQNSNLCLTDNLKNNRQLMQSHKNSEVKFADSRSQQEKYFFDQPESYKHNHERSALIQRCNKLDEQNNLLISKIQLLEMNRNKEHEILTDNSFSSLAGIQQSLLSGNRSPMIKKNLKIKILPVTSQLYSKESVSTDWPHENQFEKSNSQRKIMGSKLIERQLSPLQNLKMQSIRQSDHEHSPYFSGRIQKNRPLLQNQNLNAQTSSVFLEGNLSCTFAGQTWTNNANKMKINQVITVTYTPPIQIQDYSYFEPDQSLISKSVSPNQRNHSKSYSRFGSKKYQLVGAIKKEDSSKIQDLEELTNLENKQVGTNKSLGMIKNKIKANPFKNKQNDSIDIEINGIRDVNILQSKISGQNLKNYAKANNRLTLQQFDEQTEQKYRKNQRILKKCNGQLVWEKKKLLLQNKALISQVQQKRELTHQDFDRLKRQITSMQSQAAKNLKKIEMSKSSQQQIRAKYENLIDQNVKLKKDLKQQKQLYNYYFKISNINDDREKESEGKINKKNSLNSQKSVITSRSFANGLEKASLTTSIRKINSIEKIASDKDVSQKGTSNLVSSSLNTKINSLEKLDKKSSAYVSSVRNINFTQKSSFQVESNWQADKSNRSKAVLMLKKHTRPFIPKSGQSLNGSFVGNANPQVQIPSNGVGLFQFIAGFSGTGQTIVQKPQFFNGSR